jgi:hypothetical protein
MGGHAEAVRHAGLPPADPEGRLMPRPRTGVVAEYCGGAVYVKRHPSQSWSCSTRWPCRPDLPRRFDFSLLRLFFSTHGSVRRIPYLAPAGCEGGRLGKGVG